MDLTTIEVTKAEARAKVAEYLKAVRARHDAEDEAILRGYRALAKGHALISLPDVIGRAGFDEQHRPRLAIARADERHVWLNMSQAMASEERMVMFSPERYGRRSMARKAGRTVTVTVPAPNIGANLWQASGVRAIVPLVPPALRPQTSIAGYHVLFEAEWEPVPPRDPALLKHIGGDLWAVCATWDLTDLELAVLAGRAAER